jgi:hypothetical protein
VFGLFEELGTVHAVLRFLMEHRVQIGIRERSGPGKGKVAWRVPHQQGLVNMLRKPAYAGIYAYGRSRTDPSRRLPGHGHSGRARRVKARRCWGGLVVRGICGHRLQVNYETSGQGLTGRYCCRRRHDTYGESRCQQISARFLDEHVVAQVLSAPAPAALELLVTAAEQAGARRAGVDRIWRQRLERADFACDRARRQYQLAELENRFHDGEI